ncbi:TIGR02147 family protein [Bdellovibrionota bacterium FG-1]
MANSSGKTPKSSRPEIFGYHEYREFIRDWLAYTKARQSSNSLRSLALHSGLSVSNLSMILSGKRNLSIKTALKLASALKLNRREQDYFEALILLGNATIQEERVAAFERMNRFKDYRSSNQKETEVFRYLTHWYYVVIREMTGLPGFKPDPSWIQDRLQESVSQREIEVALKFLIDHGFIETAPDGSVTPPSKPMDCLGGIYRTALIQFHREMLVLAGKSIDTTPPEKRNLVGYTLPVDSSRFERIQRIMLNAYDEIRAISQEASVGDEIYHVELAFFPVSKCALKKNESNKK